MVRDTRRQRSRISRSRRSEPSRFVPSMLIGVSTAIAIALVSGGYWLRKTRVAVDEATMCPVSGPTAVHAILVDRSDAITPLQAQRLHQVLDRIVSDASVGERIDFYLLAGDGTQALSPVVSLCRPKSNGNDLYENSAKIHEKYDDKFLKPLDQTLSMMTSPSSEASSPIMESVKAVCVAAFGNLRKGVPAKFTIASDMIQYSHLMNHYKSRDFEKFTSTSAYKEVLSDCHGASVDILYLVRPRDVHVQDRRHQLFWEKFFDRENATLRSMEAI